MTAAELYNIGYTDLVSVIPPDAPLSPASKIHPEARGKSPGMKYASGLWGGYNWQGSAATPDQIDRSGASIGLKADHFPAVDIDVRDEALASILANVVERILPTGPVRVGLWPKRLYPFCLADGQRFARLQLFISHNEERHLVEILGAGQQYLVSGTHPKTGKPYEWIKPLVPAGELPTITFEQALELMDALQEECAMLGIECERSGTGTLSTHLKVNQDSLKTDSIDDLAAAVAAIPNTDVQFAAREDYIRFGYAIKAATQDDPDRGLEIFQEWASRWTGGENNPTIVAADWERMRAPYSVGAGYIFDLARQHGFSTAALEFSPVEMPTAETPEGEELRPETRYSDMWLADQLIQRYGNSLRYVKKWGVWLVWDKTNWTRDERGLVAGKIKDLCVEVANRLGHEGATTQERRQNQTLAKQITSCRTYEAISKLARVDQRVAAGPEEFDTQHHLLSTPSGVIDLRTGERLDPSPSQMITKRTRVAPVRGPAPLWHAYLREATNGDQEMIDYLQRVAGYILTGETREQVFFFFYGPGGRGKGTFINTFSYALGDDIARTAQMSTFTASKTERHPTELAALAGARMVMAQETQSGRSWDEQRVKSLTGGDTVTARFLFQDEFTYEPTFKLVFSGNHRPHVMNLDDAMKRRIHLLPFTIKPKEDNQKLKEELRRSELPAILAWAIEGAVKWYRDGLQAPARVREATQEYFRDEDPIGRWLGECCDEDADDCVRTGTGELYESWCRWCQKEGENPYTQKWFSTQLSTRGKPKVKSHGIMAFVGLGLVGESQSRMVN